MTAEAASVRRRAEAMASVIVDGLPQGARLIHRSSSAVSLQSQLAIELGGSRYAVSIAVVGRCDELPKPEEMPK